MKVIVTKESEMKELLKEKNVMENAILSEVSLEGNGLLTSKLKSIIFKNCKFYDCIFKHYSFMDCYFDNCRFYNCRIDEVDFYNCRIVESIIINSSIDKTLFNWNSLTGVQVQESDIIDIKEFNNNSIISSLFKGVSIRNEKTLNVKNNKFVANIIKNSTLINLIIQKEGNLFLSNVKKHLTKREVKTQR